MDRESGVDRGKVLWIGEGGMDKGRYCGWGKVVWMGEGGINEGSVDRGRWY